MLKMDDIRKEVQAEIQSVELREIYRASTRVIRDINSKFPGIKSSEIALTRKVIDTTEALTFNENAAANDTLTTTTDWGAAGTVVAGDVAVVYGSAKNDGVYTVASISTTTITFVADDQFIDEVAITCTIAFFRPKRREILGEKAVSLTYDNATNTIVDAGSANDFEAMGVSEGDILLIAGGTQAGNNAAISVASVSKYTITVNSDTTLSDDTADLGRLTIYEMAQTYSYNTESRELSFAPYVKEIQWAFENDIEIIPRDHEYLNDTDNTDELMYGIYSRNTMSLPSWIMDAADDVLRLEVLKDISIAGKARPEALVDVPQQLYGLIMQGIFAYLYALPKYFNEAQAARAQGLYENQLESVSKLESSREPNREYTTRYVY